ncbi:alpha-S1-casein [Rhinolophus ferrumequinum]|uniref:alpha-S1-casein n=1 Tax=Rhinolophus ferrumequinum TaxID=59479 RepID=UPI00140F9D56|nr:alpha-S1-casein [Rhinolophus ferrumequinum]
MKLFIFTCLVAVALAKPNLPLRHSELIQNEQDSVEEVLKERKVFKFALPITRKIREEYINELNKRELLTENQSDELKQKIASSSSSSEEVGPASNEQKHIPSEDVLNQRYVEQLNKYNQLQLEAVHDQKYIPTEKLWYYPHLEQVPRANEYNRIQLREPIVSQEQAYFYLEPFQQRGAYPYAAWYYPSQIMQYIPYSPFYDINKPIASENDEKTDIMPEW